MGGLRPPDSGDITCWTAVNARTAAVTAAREIAIEKEAATTAKRAVMDAQTAAEAVVAKAQVAAQNASRFIVATEEAQAVAAEAFALFGDTGPNAESESAFIAPHTPQAQDKSAKKKKKSGKGKKKKKSKKSKKKKKSKKGKKKKKAKKKSGKKR